MEKCNVMPSGKIASVYITRHVEVCKGSLSAVLAKLTGVLCCAANPNAKAMVPYS